MTNNISMFDSVTVDQLPPSDYFAAYTAGTYGDNYRQVRARFPSATIMSITPTASVDADCLDVEPWDATAGQAPAWINRQIARGVKRPVIYADASNMKDGVIPALNSAGISRDRVRLWSAHYDAGEHVCGPNTCSAVNVDMDGTQWTNTAMGRNLDQSTLLPGFFADVTPPKPTPPEPTGNWIMKLIENLPSLQLNSNDNDLAHWYVHRLQGVLNSVWGANLKTDGVYGPDTQLEIERIERIYNLAVDGICGPEVWGIVLAGVVA